jgi:Sec-independent protein translocase protein TatA
MIVIGAAALLFFGPDQLPKVARKVGTVVRDVQLTSQSFIREMERAADEAELRDAPRSPVEHYADPTPAPEPPPPDVEHRIP